MLQLARKFLVILVLGTSILLSAQNVYNPGGAGGGGGSGTVTSVGINGTANQVTVTGTSPITTSGTLTLSLPASIALGTDNTTAGLLTLSNGSAAAHTIFSSGATTTNTIAGFTVVPTTGHLVTCTSSGTTCTLTDGGAVPAAGANTALSNLSAVAINTALLPGTTNSIALGSSSFVWSNTFSTLFTAATGAVGTPTYLFSGASAGWFSRVANAWTYTTGTNAVFEINGGLGGATTGIYLGEGQGIGFSSGSLTSVAADVYLQRASSSTLSVGTSGSTANASGSLNLASLTATGTTSSAAYATATKCANAASPAVCGSAAAGVVAVPTGVNPTLTINTSAVTASSQILLTIDESATIASTTCNTTLSTLTQPVVTARTPGTSMTIQIGSTIATNPACVSYLVMN